MVDPDRVFERLNRLQALLARLDGVRKSGEPAYLGDEDLRAQTERRLQLAIQVCSNLGAQLLAERGGRTARDYADVFVALGELGLIDQGVAARLANAARLRNLLVHEYLAIDDRQVFATLGHLDDLRAFATVLAA